MFDEQQNHLDNDVDNLLNDEQDVVFTKIIVRQCAGRSFEYNLKIEIW